MKRICLNVILLTILSCSENEENGKSDIFNEINAEIKKIELQEKIDFLEHKVSLNLNENLYSELLSLRNQLKKG